MPNDDDKDVIRLDQFLKLQGVVGTGGQAKLLIQGGDVVEGNVAESGGLRAKRLTVFLMASG